MRASLRGAVAALCLAFGVLAGVPACSQPNVLTGDLLNNALGEMSMRKDELEAKSRTGKLTRPERKELKAFRKVNKLTGIVFDSRKKPVVRLLAGFAVLDALEKSGSDLEAVDLLIVDTLILLHDLAADLRDQSVQASESAQGQVRQAAERLIGKGDDALEAADAATSDPVREKQLRRANLMFARGVQLFFSRF